MNLNKMAEAKYPLPTDANDFNYPGSALNEYQRKAYIAGLSDSGTDKSLRINRAIGLLNGVTDAAEICGKDLNISGAIKVLSEVKEILQSLTTLSDSGFIKALEWIDVNEELPEIDVDVLCYSTERGRIVNSYDGVSIEGKHQFNGDRLNWYYDITHWMPLPNPPKALAGINEQTIKKEI